MFFPLIEKEYLLSSDQLGSLYLFLALGFAISLFSSQFLSAQMSHHKVIGISSVGSGILLSFFPLIADFYLLSFFLFCLGLLSGLFIPSAIVYLTSLISPEKSGRALGFFSSFQTLAIITAPLIGQHCQNNAPYRPIFFILGLFLTSFGLLFQIRSKNRLQKGVAPSLGFFRKVVDSKIHRWMFILHVLTMGLNLGVYTIAPIYFTDTSVYSFLTLSRILGIFAPILCGFLIDFSGFNFSLSAILALTGLSTFFLAILDSKSALFLLCLQGPLAIGLTSMIYTALSKISSKERSASLISLFASSSFLIGAGLFPQLFGYLRTWELYSVGFISLGIASILTSLVLSKNELTYDEKNIFIS